MPRGDASGTADDRRDAIVAAALRVIRRDGVDGLRAQALADEAGVSIATPYHHFASLEHVLCAAYARFLGDLQTRRDVASAAAGDDPQVRLLALLSADFSGSGAGAWRVRLELLRHAVFDDRARAVAQTAERTAIERIAQTGDVDGLSAQRLHALSCGLGTMLALEMVSATEAVDLLATAVVEQPDWRPSAQPQPEPPIHDAYGDPPHEDSALRILDATVQVIGEVGAAQLTFAGVAERAGCSDSLARYHYRTRRALIDAAFAYDFARSSERQRYAVTTPVEPLERLRFIYVARSPEHLAALRPTLVLWSEYVGAGADSPVFRRSARERLEAWVDYGLELGNELALAGHTQASRITRPNAVHEIAVNTAAGALWLIGALTDAEYPTVVNSTIDDLLGREDREPASPTA